MKGENMIFSNEQIDTDHLPSIQQLTYKTLHKDYLTVELISSAIFFGLLLIGAVIIIGFNLLDLPIWVRVTASIMVILLIFLSVWHTYAAFSRKKYALREKDIIYQEGLIWRKAIAIPFNRVQHAELQQGPIERLFKLSKLNIFTAGGSSSDLTISGLHQTEANRIKQYILQQTVLDEEE